MAVSTVREPLEIEYGMTFEVREQGVTASGYDYYDLFGKKWDETYPDELLPEAHKNPYKNQPRREAIYELTDPFESDEEYSHVGGYPYFVQNDPRDEFKELRVHGEPADYRLRVGERGERRRRNRDHVG